ncbi:MAG: MFS transporter [Acetobacteraceae bacterium]
MQPAQTTTRQWLAFAVLLAGGFLPPVDFFIVNVALPSIHDSLDASPAQVQLVISGYAAGYAVFLITGGRMGDLFGRRRCFLLGLAGFAATNLLCGIALSPVQLVVGRVLQGLAAALLAPQVLGAIRTLHTEERALARAFSIYGVMMGLAAAIGQFAGGALVQWSPWDLGWRVVFLLKVPVCLLILFAAWALVPETAERRKVTLDVGGAALISAALGAVVVPLSLGRDQGWPLWVFLVLATVPFLVAGFIAHERRLMRRGGMPLVDLRLFAIPGFRRGVVVATLFFFTTSFYFLFGIYQQEGRGVEPLQTGLAILPYGFGLFLGPLVSAPLMRRAAHNMLAIGMSIQVTFYALIGVLVALGIANWPLFAVVFLAGLGQGIAFPRLFNTILGVVPAEQAGVAAGITNSALQMGAAGSAAAIGTLFFSVLDGGTGERAYGWAFAVAQWTLTTALAIAMVMAIPAAWGRFGRARSP